MLIRKIAYLIKHRYYYRNRRRFGYLAPNSYIKEPLRLEGKQNISIGNGVIIQPQTWLAAVPLTNAPECKLSIGEGSIIGHFNHIYATKRISIGKKVMTADKVYISDNLHGFDDPYIPIIDQPIIQNGEVEIGDGTWIGENACILGVKIGKNCVIGANSVVSKDVPDYCVVSGNPARIIKRYDINKEQWI